MPMDWGAVLVGQLQIHWDLHLRPRLEGLTDEEYFWEPVDDCWTLRRTQEGRYAIDSQWPEPSPPPVTTIACRIIHIGVGCFATRAGTFFGEDSLPNANMFDPRRAPADLPATAADALVFLDGAYRQWHDGIAALDEAGLSAPLGRKGAHLPTTRWPS